MRMEFGEIIVYDGPARTGHRTEQEPPMSTVSFIARDDERLSLRIPGAAWKASGQRAAAAMAEKGMLIKNDAVRDWSIDAMREEGAWVLVSGPPFNGRSLKEALSSGLGKSAALKLLASLACALRLLAREGRLPERLYEEGILFAPDGELLILPTALTASACASQKPDAFLAFDSDPELAAASLIRSMLRHVCAQGRGEAPLGLPLALLEPSLDGALAALADRGDKGAAPRIGDYCAAFDEASKRGFFRTLGDDEAEAAERTLQAALVSINKKEARTRFMKRRGGLISGIAIGMAALLAIGLLSRTSPGPDYSRLDAPDLALAYYSALDGLDMMGLEACVTGSAGKDDRNFVGNLTVISKMRQAYAASDDFTNAKDWLAQGSPPIGEGQVVYGISGLSIRELGPGSVPADPAGTGGPGGARSSDRIFEARYTIWSSYGTEESMRVEKNERIDTLSLRAGKQGWKIFRIERIHR
jgi:hypothetical protein